MVYEAKDVASDLTLDADVCVVGSGAGGGSIAAELAEGGLSVVVLEEGGYHRTPDFSMDPDTATRLLYRDAGTSMMVGVPAVFAAEGRCVGGTTVINGGMCWRTPEKVLKRWQWEFGLERITEKDMEPFFARVEERIHVAYQDPESIGRDSLLFKRGADALGYKVIPDLRNQVHCPGSNNCAFGCPTGAKQSVLVTYIPRAVAAGASVYANCRATRVVTRNGRAAGVLAVVSDPLDGRATHKVRVNARLTVVAGGAVQSPVLLKRSGLCRGSRHLGRHFRIHPNVKCLGVFDELVEGYKGVSQVFQVREFQDEGLIMAETMLPPNVTAALALPQSGRALHEAMRDYNKMVICGALAEDEGEGSVHAAPGGMAIMRYDVARQDARKLIRGAAILAEILFAAGARKVFLPFRNLEVISSADELQRIYERDIPPADIEVFTVHLMGTCRMSRDPRRGVVDSFCQSHEVRNLFVCDASVFPTPLGVNPQETIMALSTRTAAHILDNRTRYLVQGIQSSGMASSRSMTGMSSRTG